MSPNIYSLASRVKLATGHTMPQIQLGLYEMDPRTAYQSVRWALAAGYRGFDSAQWYYNEAEAGKAIRDFLADPNENTEGLNLKREDIHYTTKVFKNDVHDKAVRRSISESVQACGLGYVDLFLLHSPLRNKQERLASWKALEDAVAAGEVKMAGVSNFGVKHIEELMASSPKVHPVVNQIEVHPFNTQTAIRETCAKYNIVVEAYAPLVRAQRMRHPRIVTLAKKYSCTPAQLLIRYSLQHNMITLPKSTRKERLIENVQVNGFQISEEDMAAMDGLDEHLVTDWDPAAQCD